VGGSVSYSISVAATLMTFYLRTIASSSTTASEDALEVTTDDCAGLRGGCVTISTGAARGPVRSDAVYLYVYKSFGLVCSETGVMVDEGRMLLYMPERLAFARSSSLTILSWSFLMGLS